MFSNQTIRQLRYLVLIGILGGLIFYPRVTFSTVHATGNQRGVSHEVKSRNGDLANLVDVYKSENKMETGETQLVALLPNSLNERPEAWKSWDVIPSLSLNAISIYKRGLEMGNNPHAFSKIGDGEISAAWFLTSFDQGPEFYDLGPYAGLQPTIDFFAGSFERQGMASRRGFNAQRILDTSLADPKFCQTNETPLDCELRLNHPGFALISMGTNQVWEPAEFERGVREIIDILIAHGVVPILSTKADNLEGDNCINLTIARLAVEYDIPLWNFWRAVQPLPNHGMQKDNEHLTYYPNDFTHPESMHYAWPVRNLSALQVLESLMRGIQN